MMDDIANHEQKAHLVALGRARQAHRQEFHKDKHTSWAGAFDAAVVAAIDAYRASRAEQGEWEALRGAAPDATGDLSSEQFVRESRDGWERE